MTTISLSNFYSLNLCLVAIFWSINISVVPLSKSIFTVIPLCISTFSTPIFNYTSLSILNVLFIVSAHLSLTVPFGASVHIPFCCAFLCSGYTTIFQFYYGRFFSVLHSKHQIFLLSSSDIFSPTIVSFLLYWVYLTLLSAFLFLYFYASRQLLYYTFLSFSLETKLYLWFSFVLVSL